MRKFRSIYLIEMTVPKDFLGKPSRRFLNLRDGGTGENVPKGWNVVVGMIVTKYQFEPVFAFVNNPSGRLFAC